jgi:hypothetical protein
MDINTKRLRCTLGWLAMLLPWLSVILSMVFGHTSWPDSISITYYQFQTACPALMIILGSASILLFAYKGYEKKDDILNTIAGVFGLLILLFPTIHEDYPVSGIFNLPSSVNTVIHLVSAVIFFGLLSINSLFLFTKSSGEMTKNKKIRNIIYRVCGIGMIASFALLLLPIYWAVWLTEAIALLFFGISWLTKADYYPWLFADKK